MAFQPVAVPDIAGIFIAARDSAARNRLAQTQQAQAELQLQRQQQLPDAVRQYSAGSPDALMGLSPELYMQAENHRLQNARAEQEAAARQQELRAKQAKEAEERALRTANAQKYLAQVPPEHRAAAEQRIYELTQQGVLDRAEVTGPQSSPQDIARIAAQGDLGLSTGLKPAEAIKPTGDMIEAASRLGFGTDIGRAEKDPRWAGTLSRLNKEKQSNINLGTAGATTATQTDQQKAIIDARDALGLIADMKSAATDPRTGQVNFSQFLGYAPKGKKWTLDVVASIDPSLVPAEQREWFDRMSQFRASVDKYRSSEFKRLIGSAQTDTEVRNLTNSVLSGDMNSQQFSAALAQLERTTQRTIDIADDVLSRGFTLGTTKYRQEFQRLENQQRAAEAGGSSAPPPNAAAAIDADQSLTPEQRQRLKAALPQGGR